jgi:hypothetical protein
MGSTSTRQESEAAPLCCPGGLAILIDTISCNMQYCGLYRSGAIGDETDAVMVCRGIDGKYQAVGCNADFRRAEIALCDRLGF